MSSFYTKEFKEAIANLPSKEKDKLILRLLKKDLALAKRLDYELVQDEPMEEYREKLQQELDSGINYIRRLHSVGALFMEARHLSGSINDHVYTTKDKFGEAYFNLWIINEILTYRDDLLQRATHFKTRKFCVYLIAKVYKVLGLIVKLHEDFFMEFESELKRLGKLINANDVLRMLARENELDVAWLLNAEIPENIAEIAKEVRANGGLK